VNTHCPSLAWRDRDPSEESPRGSDRDTHPCLRTRWEQIGGSPSLQQPGELHLGGMTHPLLGGTVGAKRDAHPGMRSTTGEKRDGHPGTRSTTGEKRDEHPGTRSTTGEKRDEHPGMRSMTGAKRDEHPGRRSTTGAKRDAHPSKRFRGSGKSGGCTWFCATRLAISTWFKASRRCGACMRRALRQ
jgi:hypothetical protein